MQINIIKKIMSVREFLNILHEINLKPQYQREFVYDAEKSSKVIDSILLGIPLNILYLNENSEGNFKYEVIDGQQRLKSIVNFCLNSHSLIKMSKNNWNDRVWEGLPQEHKKTILDYKLDFYIVSKDNDTTLKLDIFKRINTVGEKLNEIELLNATYPGTFIDELKKFCVDNENKLKTLTNKTYLRGDTEEIILDWFSENPALFLAQNQTKSFNKSDYPIKIIQVLNWFNSLIDKNLKNRIFNNKDCLRLFNKYSKKKFSIQDLSLLINRYIINEEITNKNGILEYSLQEINGEQVNEQLLNLRTFPSEWKEEYYIKQNKKCDNCEKDLTNSREYALSELDHIKSWKNGGLTEKNNCRLLCQSCNRKKSSK